MTHGCLAEPGRPWLLGHLGTVGMADHTSLHVPVPDPGPPQSCAGACSLGQLFPLFTPSRKEELVNKGKIQALCCMGPAAGFLETRKWGPILCQKVTFRGTLRMLIHPPGPLCLCPPAPHGHGGYLMLCLSRKWGKEAGTLPVIFGPQLEAMAQLPLLSVSLEQGQRFASRGKGG